MSKKVTYYKLVVPPIQYKWIKKVDYISLFKS